MSNAIADDVKKLVIKGTLYGEPVQVDHYFRVTAPVSGVEVDLIAQWNTHCRPTFVACAGESLVVDQFRVEDRRSHPFGSATDGHIRTFIQNAADVGAGPWVGQAAGESDPSFSSAIISWYSDFSGRGERGRTFMPGVPDAFSTPGNNNTLTDAAKAAYHAYAQSLITLFDGANTGGSHDYAFVLWRSHMTGAIPAPPTEPDEVANLISGHNEEGKPIYTWPPVTKPPFNYRAALHRITLDVVQPVLHSQRRRGAGVRISRRGREA